MCALSSAKLYAKQPILSKILRALWEERVSQLVGPKDQSMRKGNDNYQLETKD